MENKKIRTIKRVRAKIYGTAERPRLAVFRSNKNLSAQLIDDVKGNTIVTVSNNEIKIDKVSQPLAKATETGKLLAKKALAKNILTAVFDRRYYKYHGQVKALADGAREEGLKI